MYPSNSYIIVRLENFAQRRRDAKFRILLCAFAPLRGSFRTWSLNFLQNYSISLTYSDAHSDQSILLFLFLEFYGCRQQNTRSAHTQRMTEGYGAAVGVNACIVIRQTPGTCASQRLCS